jgi:hypothetical protein
MILGRARQLACGGIADLMADLHPQLQLRDVLASQMTTERRVA